MRKKGIVSVATRLDMLVGIVLGVRVLFFHCNQVDHKKADWPRLASGAVRAPAPATLRITDDHEGRIEALVLSK